MESVAHAGRLVARLLEREADRRPLAWRDVEAIAIGRDGTLLGLEGSDAGTTLFAPALRARGVVVRLDVEEPSLHALLVSPGAPPLEWARGKAGASIRLVDGRAGRVELVGGALPPLVHDGTGWREDHGQTALPTGWAGHLLLAADPEVAGRTLSAATNDERLTRAPRATAAARTRPSPRPRPGRTGRRRRPG